MLGEIMIVAEAALAARTTSEASQRFFEAVRPLGATYIQTRLYRRPAQYLTCATHWAAGGFILRQAPATWVDSAAFDYVCFQCNPLLDAIRQSRTTYRFSDFAPHCDRQFGAYWDALSEAQIADAICATSYGPHGAIASLHLGLGERALDPASARTMQLAGLILTEHLLEAAQAQAGAPRLTRRELDCMAFVSDGKTDWEISVILSLSEATVRFHIDNARRKLGAVSRAQAAARLVRSGMI
jgi:LuxR family quorum sensing-dependent transcriptional regulator